MSMTCAPDPADPFGCCTPLAGEPLSADRAALLAPLLKAVADPARLRLLSLVMAADGGEACVCDLTPHFELSQPTISHHLKVLREAGLVESEKRGTWVHYRVRPDAVAALRSLFDSVGSEVPA